MGEPEQLIAEPDEWEGELEPDLDGLHPPSLQQQNPRFISEVVSKIVSFVTAMGWYILGLLVLGYFVWQWMKPKVRLWQKQREEAKDAAEYYKNPDKVLARERAIHEARQQMQEKYIREVEKRREQEEKQRQERIEDWDPLQQGESYRNKIRHTASGTSSGAASNTSATKKSDKPNLRPEYSPLTGGLGGGACRWRPGRRGPSGGG